MPERYTGVVQNPTDLPDIVERLEDIPSKLQVVGAATADGQPDRLVELHGTAIASQRVITLAADTRDWFVYSGTSETVGEDIAAALNDAKEIGVPPFVLTAEPYELFTYTAEVQRRRFDEQVLGRSVVIWDATQRIHALGRDIADFVALVPQAVSQTDQPVPDYGLQEMLQLYGSQTWFEAGILMDYSAPLQAIRAHGRHILRVANNINTGMTAAVHGNFWACLPNSNLSEPELQRSHNYAQRAPILISFIPDDYPTGVPEAAPPPRVGSIHPETQQYMFVSRTNIQSLTVTYADGHPHIDHIAHYTW